MSQKRNRGPIAQKILHELLTRQEQSWDDQSYPAV